MPGSYYPRKECSLDEALLYFKNKTIIIKSNTKKSDIYTYNINLATFMSISLYPKALDDLRKHNFKNNKYSIQAWKQNNQSNLYYLSYLPTNTDNVTKLSQSQINQLNEYMDYLELPSVQKNIQHENDTAFYPLLIIIIFLLLAIIIIFVPIS